MPSNLKFPPGFIWGTATSSYQIEGAVNQDERGESIWDRFCRTPGKVKNGDTGDTACDHYRRYAQDIEMMAGIGITAYRFSMAWPRVIPSGTSEVNHAGLDFYDRLVDGLLEAGITPYPTLYHWDLPQALEEKGGWTNRDTAHAFAHYAAVAAEHLGDRVKNWWTINEPWCVAELGYRFGQHAPGRQEERAWLAATHHALLAHGLGFEAIRQTTSGTRTGIVINLDAHTPRSNHPADLEAAGLAHILRNRWYLDPVLLGRYPQPGIDHYQWDQAEVQEGDMRLISYPLDHLGINYYTRAVVHDEKVSDAARPPPIVEDSLPKTEMGWEIFPDGLKDLLIQINQDYQLPPVYITENGAAFPDRLEDGAVHDSDRINFLQRHFSVTAQSIEKGVPVKGYFVWSLMDNFEWAHGYAYRFGLVRVDFETQERLLKKSAHWYKDLIAKTGS